MEIIKDRINNEMEVFSNLIKTLNGIGIKYKIKGNILLHFIKYSKNYYKYFNSVDNLDLNAKYKNIDDVIDIFRVIDPMCVVLTTKDSRIRRIVNLKIYNIDYVEVDNEEDIIIEDEFTEIYNLNGQTFYGNSIEGIFKDKIESISTKTVQIKSKDIIGLYILKNMLLINDDEFIKILDKYKDGNFEYIKEKNCKRAMQLYDGIESEGQSIAEDAYNLICMSVSKLLGEKIELKPGGFLWK